MIIFCIYEESNYYSLWLSLNHVYTMYKPFITQTYVFFCHFHQIFCNLSVLIFISSAEIFYSLNCFVRVPLSHNVFLKIHPSCVCLSDTLLLNFCKSLENHISWLLHFPCRPSILWTDILRFILLYQ